MLGNNREYNPQIEMNVHFSDNDHNNRHKAILCSERLQ